MNKKDLITKAEELKESIGQAQKYSQEFYEELLSEFETYILALKNNGDNYPWELALRVQEQLDEVEKSMSSEDEFEEYVFLNDVLGVLLK